MTADSSQERLPNYILPAQLNLEPIQSRPVATAPPDKEHIVPEIEYYDLVVIDVGDEMYEYVNGDQDEDSWIFDIFNE